MAERGREMKKESEVVLGSENIWEEKVLEGGFFKCCLLFYCC